MPGAGTGRQTSSRRAALQKGIRACGLRQGERPRTLGWPRLERSRLRGELSALDRSPRRGNGGQGAHLSSLVANDRIRGKGTELCQGRFRLGGRKNAFTVRVVTLCDRLPGEVVGAPACRPSGGIWTMPSTVRCNFWAALKRLGSWTGE